MTGSNSTEALSSMKNGSAIDGISETSFSVTKKYAVRAPPSAEKYAASGFSVPSIRSISCGSRPLLIAALPLSTGIVIRNNVFYPEPRGVENWGVYFVKNVTDFRIENNFFSPAGEDAITVWHSARGVIAHNRGGGNGENTIDVKDSRDIVIRDNIAINDGDYNIVVHRVDSGPDTSNVLVTANHCVGGGRGGSLTAGIALLDVQGSKVIGNHIEKSAGEAIFVHDGPGGGGNQIRGNFLRHNGILRPSEAIVIQGESRTRIEDNNIRP